MTEEEILWSLIASDISDAICVGVVYGRDNTTMPPEVLNQKTNIYTDKIMKRVREFLIP